MNTQRIEVDVAALRDLAGQGKTDREIGWALGCSPQVIGERRREAGIAAGVGMHGRKPVDVARVAELAALGWSDHRIGRELGRTENLIRARRHEAGIEPGNPHKRNKVTVSVEKVDNPLSGYSNVRLADAEFAKRIGDRRFSEIKFQPTYALSVPPPSSSHGSVTGCAAAMCAG